MKKDTKNNFTKLTRKGISLIVLIVTIIVVIILAAVVILTISKNNPIESAKEATFKEDVRSFQDDLALTISKEYTSKQGQRDEKINAEGYDNIVKYIPSFSEKYDEKFKIVNDELAFFGVDETEIKWCEDLNVKILFNAEKWDETATDESCFQWGSDVPGEEGYNVIIGYNSTLENNPKVRIPSRCQKINCSSNSDETVGRSFLNNIQKIEIPNTVTELGDYSFGGTYGNALKSVESITIPDSVTIIGAYAFYSCKSLKEIDIPEGVTSIGQYAFGSCSNLTNIAIPEGVTSIEVRAFSYCSNLTNITIPEGVTSIGMLAFAGCSNLTNIAIPEGVTSIGKSAFSGCSNLTNIAIPEGVTSIGEDAFSECSNLTNITISEGVTSIGEWAFSNCSNLTNITIPASVTSIGRLAFGNCSNLTNINFQGTISEWNNISKYSEWNLDSNIATITCTDGTITL